MRIYSIIIRRFYWEGLEEELHQHFQECMSYVELGQPWDSMQESFQSSLPSFERGERSMSNSMCMRGIVGKGSVHVKQVLFSDCTCYFTICMQVMTPKRSNVSCKSHGNYWAIKISEFGHSLDEQREIFHHDGCFPKEPNIYLTFNNSEMTWETIKWWGKNLPHHYLM